MTNRAFAIYAFISACGSAGTTCDEIAVKLGFTPQQVGASLSELHEENKAFPTEDHRLTGLFPAPVWKSTWVHQ